jgi:hypothetical protein
MKSSITEMFSNPDTFSQDLMNEKEDLRIPVLIVIAGGVVGYVICLLYMLVVM